MTAKRKPGRGDPLRSRPDGPGPDDARTGVSAASRTAKGSASRERILSAAAGVFARLGYDRARMADLLAASGASKGALYFYFDSKEALALAVLETRQAQWLESVRDRLAAFPPGRERLLALAPLMAELHRQDEEVWAIAKLSSSLAEVGSVQGRAAELTREWIDLVAELLGEAVEAMPVEQRHSLAVLLVGSFDGVKALLEVSCEGAERDRELAAAGEMLADLVGAYVDQLATA